MKQKLTVAQLVAGAGALAATLFSFFNFYEYAGDGRSAWSQDTGAFVTTIPAILAIVLLAWTIAELAGTNLPKQVLTYSAAQLKATWGISAAGIMLAFMTQDVGWDKGIGFWFMLFGSVAMAVGTVMSLLGKGTQEVNFGGGSKQPTTPPPFASPPPPPPPPGMAPPSPPAG
ncbi:MAG: hypothetical protein Q7V57_03175 [Actinomycetota bacterium]|nr:hypothetical protein [Actinomycetota bacterium]